MSWLASIVVSRHFLETTRDQASARFLSDTGSEYIDTGVFPDSAVSLSVYARTCRALKLCCQ